MGQNVLKDPIWGEVQLFPWEKTLLNTSAFNRLHNVVQNSNAYKVYPSAKHSRFVHSVGVMHVATRICLNVYSNSRVSAGTAEANEIHNEIKKISDRFIDLGGNLDEIKEIISTQGFNWLCEPENVPGLLVVRIASLLHDAGHLPYSHIFENALELWMASGGNPRFKGDLVKGVAIHEKIGEWLMKFLDTSDPHTENARNLRVLIQVASDLLHGSKFPIHKSMISGVIDADRIDYVRRDCEMSGFIKSSVDYDRLFRNFEVSSSLDPLISKERSFFVRPGRKAQSDFEKVIWERYQEYMYVVGHHKVSFFDEITKRIITELLRLRRLDSFVDDLNNLSDFCRPERGPGTRHSQLDVPIKIMDFLLYSCDDGILDYEIKMLFKDISKGNAIYTEDQDFNLKRLTALVTAHCEKRDYFKTVFKDDESFWVWMEKFTRVPQSNWKKHPIDVNRIATEIKSKVEKIERSVYDDPTTRGTIVIIGGAYGKLKSGLTNINTVKVFRLGGLSAFIESKRETMRAFNLWYCKENAACEGAILKVIARELNIVPEPNLFEGIEDY